MHPKFQVLYLPAASLQVTNLSLLQCPYLKEAKTGKTYHGVLCEDEMQQRIHTAFQCGNTKSSAYICMYVALV